MSKDDGFEPLLPYISIFYPLLALILILIFRFFVPSFASFMPQTDLLKIFNFKAHIAQGFLTFINLFPAIFMSSLALPFALKVYEEGGEERFSPVFFEGMKTRLYQCVAGAVFFALCSLLIEPYLSDYYLKAERETKIYRESLSKARLYSEKGEWLLAGYFKNICNSIWRENPAFVELSRDIEYEVQRIKFSSPRPPAKPAAPSLPAQKKPLTAPEALRLASLALDEKRYYDANYLGNIAVRLSGDGSMEASRGRRIAAIAWNEIARQEPGPEQKELYSIYERKRAGYEALISENWIQAYYIFKELMPLVPGDNDIKKYFELCGEGLKNTSFFLDEVNLMFQDVRHDAVFSLPFVTDINHDLFIKDTMRTGRIVFKTSQLTRFKDFSLGSGFEAIGFNNGKKPLFKLKADFIKVIPVEILGEWKTAILLKAIDRDSEAVSRGPEWEALAGANGVKYSGTQVLLEISYEDFLLAAAAFSSINDFFISDLLEAAKNLQNAGFIKEVFYVRIIRDIYLPVIFLPLSVFAIIMGWKFRAYRKVSYSLPLMLFILPLVFGVLVYAVKVIFNLFTVWSVMNYGFFTSCVAIVAGAVILFILSLLTLAAQRS